MSTPKESLKRKILEEMTVDYSKSLEHNFELAKQFIRITKEGKVEVLMKDKLTGKEQIQLYLIGKTYAKEAGLADTDDAGTDELIQELGIPEGSLLPWLKSLRDDNRIRQIKREWHAYHTLPVNLVESVLEAIVSKIGKKSR